MPTEMEEAWGPVVPCQEVEAVDEHLAPASVGLENLVGEALEA
jgi:hypothetical protein